MSQRLHPRQLTGWGQSSFVGIDFTTSVLPGQVRSWRGPSCLCASSHGQTQPRQSCWRYFSTLSHMHPLRVCLRIGIPASPLVPPLALSTATGTGVFWWGPRFGLANMHCSWRAPCERRGQGVSAVPVAVADGARFGSFCLGSCFHHLPGEIIFICGKQP